MKLLILLSRVPFPTEKGDKLRAFHQIRCLSQTNEIIVCALNEGRIHPDAISTLKRYCKEVHIIQIGRAGMVWNLLKAVFNGNPLQVGYFYRSRVSRKILQLISEYKPDHLYCQLLRMAEYVRHLSIPKTLDYQDVFSMGMKRRADSANWWKKPFFSFEYKRLLKYEEVIFDDFTHKTIISAPDKELIPHPLKEQIIVIPNGVDQDFFVPVNCSKKNDILFTGNMGYPPNVDAAIFLVKEIFPLVRETIPDCRLMIAGANPHPDLLALRSDSIEVTGWVNDIRDCYSASRVFIAPMRIGTGLQNKLLEAMSMKLPCVTSSLANNALAAQDGKEILVGATAREYADRLITLIKDPEFADQIASNGHDFVIRTFNWKSSTTLLEQLMKHQTQNVKH
jgi:sugar transferase (PEP-CTERM/EpsH1 system associated)